MKQILKLAGLFSPVFLFGCNDPSNTVSCIPSTDSSHNLSGDIQITGEKHHIFSAFMSAAMGEETFQAELNSKVEKGLKLNEVAAIGDEFIQFYHEVMYLTSIVGVGEVPEYEYNGHLISKTGRSTSPTLTHELDRALYNEVCDCYVMANGKISITYSGVGYDEQSAFGSGEVEINLDKLSFTAGNSSLTLNEAKIRLIDYAVIEVASSGVEGTQISAFTEGKADYFDSWSNAARADDANRTVTTQAVGFPNPDTPSEVSDAVVSHMIGGNNPDYPTSIHFDPLAIQIKSNAVFWDISISGESLDFITTEVQSNKEINLLQSTIELTNGSCQLSNQ